MKVQNSDLKHYIYGTFTDTFSEKFQERCKSHYICSLSVILSVEQELYTKLCILNFWHALIGKHQDTSSLTNMQLSITFDRAP